MKDYSQLWNPVKPLLAPSILAANHANLLEGVKLVESLSLDWLHVDIMDGHFVPNLTFGPQTVADLRSETGLFLDVHLMLDNPHQFVEPFAKAGADLISIHVEPDYDVADTLSRIRDLGARPAIVINPKTPFEAAVPYLDQVELFLLMTVQPGFGGQSFQMPVLDKIRKAYEYRQQHNLNYRIEVDGGIDLQTVEHAYQAGADTIVSGSSFFKYPDKAEFVASFENTFNNPRT